MRALNQNVLLLSPLLLSTGVQVVLRGHEQAQILQIQRRRVSVHELDERLALLRTVKSAYRRHASQRVTIDHFLARMVQSIELGGVVVPPTHLTFDSVGFTRPKCVGQRFTVRSLMLAVTVLGVCELLQPSVE
jgi:hypothetical protein